MGTQTKVQARVRGIKIESWNREVAGVTHRLIAETRRSRGNDTKRVKNTK